MQSERISFGAKILEKEELNHIFPQMDKLMDEIAHIQASSPQIRGIDEEDAENNNTFAILGGRGSGKSSILLTVRNELHKNQNIVFPMIELNRINNNFDLFGCILSSVKKVLTAYLSKVKEVVIYSRTEEDETFKECYLKKTSKLKQEFDKVMEYYLYTHEEYRRLLTQNYTDFNSYRQNSTQMLSASTELKIRFNSFITEWSDYIKRYRKETNLTSSESNPLFCFFFDDIDLCPDKIVELINVILQFMMHPNVICFMSGDDKQMKEVLKNHYKGYSNSLELAENVLAKVLPYPYRYDIRTWSNELKPQFKSIREAKCLWELIQEFLEMCTQSKDCEPLFVYKEEHAQAQKTNYNPQAFIMFSDQTRKLNYVYYNLVNILNESQEDESIGQSAKKKEQIQSVFKYIYKDYSAFHGEECKLEDNLFNLYLDSEEKTVPIELKSAINSFFELNLGKMQAIGGIYFWVFFYLAKGYPETDLEQLKAQYYCRKSEKYQPIDEPNLISMLQKEELCFGIEFEESYLQDTTENEDTIIKVSRNYYKIISQYTEESQARAFKRHFNRIKGTEVADKLIQFANGDDQNIEQSLLKIENKLFDEVKIYINGQASIKQKEKQLEHAKQLYCNSVELELRRLTRLFADNGIINLKRTKDIQKLTLSYCNATLAEPAYLTEFIHYFRKSMLNKESDDTLELLYRTYVQNFEQDYYVNMKRFLFNAADGLDGEKVNVFGIHFEIYYLSKAYIKLCPDKNETIREQIKEWMKDAE